MGDELTALVAELGFVLILPMCLSSAGCHVTHAPLPPFPLVLPPPVCPAPSRPPLKSLRLLDPGGTRAGWLVPPQAEPDHSSVATKRAGPVPAGKECH